MIPPKRACECCAKPTLRSCSCCLAPYCSNACQLKEWEAHKGECSEAARVQKINSSMDAAWLETEFWMADSVMRGTLARAVAQRALDLKLDTPALNYAAMRTKLVPYRPQSPIPQRIWLNRVLHAVDQRLAARRLDEVVDGLRKFAPRPGVFDLRCYLARVLAAQGKSDEAAALVAELEPLVPAEDWRCVFLLNVARVNLAVHRRDGTAAERLQHLVAHVERCLGPKHPHTIKFKSVPANVVI